MLSERVLTPRVLLAAALAALLVNAAPLAPPWYDELYTLEVFVPQGPAGFLADYRVPNNHLFYTLLLWAWQSLFGEHPLAARALGLLLTALALPALFVAGRALAGARAGALAALVLGSSQIAGNFAAQVRGYGLSIALLAVCLAAAALWAGSGLRDRRALAVYAGSGALAIWTLPSNLVFVVMVALWTLLLAGWGGQRTPWRRVPWLALPLLGLLGYAPVHGQLALWAGLGVWSAYGSFLDVLARDLLVADLPWLLPLALLLAAMTGRWTTPAAWWLLAGCALVLLAPLLGPVPWPRNYVPLLAPLALAGGLLLDSLSRRLPGGLPAVLAGLLAALLVRPLLAPAPSVDAGVVATRAGELVAPYYLREDFRPGEALRALLDETDPPPSVLLTRVTSFLELQSQFLALAGRHFVCQVEFSPDMGTLRLLCTPPLPAEARVARLVLVARSEEDARLLQHAFAGVAPGFAELPLRALPGSAGYHRTWFVEAR